MTINSPEKYMANIWDWAILDGCFGITNIRPTDIDGFVERNGEFLMLETKQPRVPIPLGQQRTHQAWVKKGGTVIIIWGLKDTPEKIQMFSPYHPFPDGKVWEQADIDILRKRVKNWYEWAERQKP